MDGLLLVGLLALFRGRGTGTSRFCLCFLLGGVTLRLRLVLLGLALVLEIFVAKHAADGLFGQALGALDDALHSFLRPTLLLVVRHGVPSSFAHIELTCSTTGGWLDRFLRAAKNASGVGFLRYAISRHFASRGGNSHGARRSNPCSRRPACDS